MFKIGDLVTKEQFIKYAPYGMELKHDSAEVILRYDMKAYEDFCNSDDIEDWEDTIPGFMHCGYTRLYILRIPLGAYGRSLESIKR